MLEVWDVIDKASKRAISESLTLAHNVDETAEGRHTFPLDATMVDVYHGCHAAIFLIDPSKKWTYEYVQRELATVPEHIPTCVVLNFRDYPASKRLIRLEEVEADMEYSFGKRPFRPFVMEASLLNCYGLQALSTFLHIPFLCLKRASLEQAMQLNTHAIVQAQEAMKTVRANSYDAYERKIDAATGGSNVSNAQGEAASRGDPGPAPARQSRAAPPTPKEAAITWEKLSNTTLGEAPLLIGGAAIGAAVTGVTAVANLTPAQIAENVKSVASVGNVAKAIGLGPKEKKGHYVDEPVEKVAPQFSHLTGRGGAAAAAFGGREIDDDDAGAPNSLTPDVRGGEEMDDFFEGDTPRRGGGGSSSDEDGDSDGGRGGGREGTGTATAVVTAPRFRFGGGPTTTTAPRTTDRIPRATSRTTIPCPYPARTTRSSEAVRAPRRRTCTSSARTPRVPWTSTRAPSPPPSGRPRVAATSTKPSATTPTRWRRSLPGTGLRSPVTATATGPAGVRRRARRTRRVRRVRRRRRGRRRSPR